MLTTRELARMIKQAGIDFANLPDERLRQPAGRVHRRGDHLRRHGRRDGGGPADRVRGRDRRPTSRASTSPRCAAWKA
ncbi:MAG: hypothetical protein MZW92_05900 [Comamonadaceae bacterium]|nr:hypothetical protein [Comamonadaceae bacterium]